MPPEAEMNEEDEMIKMNNGNSNGSRPVSDRWIVWMDDVTEQVR